MKKKDIKNIGMFFLYFIYEIIPLFILNILNINFSNWNYIQKNIYLILNNLIYLLFVVYIYRNELKHDFKDFKNKWFELLLKYFPVYVIGIILMGISNSLVSGITNMDISNNEDNVRKYIELFPVYMCFSTVIYAPIVEEITFRKSIRNVISNKYLYIFVSGVIFGLIHITGQSTDFNDILMSIPYIIMGLDFAYICYKSNNIFTTIMLHSIHNFILLFIQIIGG